MEEAYAVHAALMEAIGPVGGYKVSQKAGRPPVVAPIPESRCFASGAHVEGADPIGIELEVGFVVVDTIPSPEDPAFGRKLIDAVRPAPMIELVATRIEGALAEDPHVKLADLQANEALICGAPVPDWDGRDFATPDIDLRSAQGPLHHGPGQVPGGSALQALEATLRALGGRFGGLHPGQRVITGTLRPLLFLPMPQQVSGAVSGLGPVAVDLSARMKAPSG